MDLRIVHLRQVFAVSKMLDVPGPPHLLYLSGPDSVQVAEVDINGVRGYAFDIIDRRTVAVHLPENYFIQSVSILGREMGSAKEAEVFVGFTNQITQISGIQALAQYWLKCLLTTPGSDPWSKWGGAGRLALTRNTAQEGDYNSSLSMAVSRTNKQVVSRQAPAMWLPRDERLLSAKLARVSRDPRSGEYTADIDITSQAMQTVRAGVA